MGGLAIGNIMYRERVERQIHVLAGQEGLSSKFFILHFHSGMVTYVDISHSVSMFVVCM